MSFFCFLHGYGFRSPLSLHINAWVRIKWKFLIRPHYVRSPEGLERRYILHIHISTSTD
jgi:hypothetical protein